MWKIELDGKPHKIELLVSSMSGMKRILKDGYLIFEKQMRFGNFHHSMPIDNHMISIIELEDRFDFRIDNQPFSMLYLAEKTKKNFKQEEYPKKYKESYDYEPKPAAPRYSEPQPKKKDNFEFDTGFSAFDYKPTRESLQKSQPQRSRPEPEFVSTPWVMEQENDYKPPPAQPPQPKKEDFNWDAPTNFQFDGSNAPVQNRAPPQSQPSPAPRQPAPVTAPPAQVYTQPPPPPPVKQEPRPVIDFLDTDQPNDLADDLFADGIGVVPLGTQYKQPTLIDFPQQAAMQTAPVGQPAIGGLDFAAPQPGPQPIMQPATQPPSYQTTAPPMNPTAPSTNLSYQGVMDYTQPSTGVSASPSLQYTQPPMNPTYVQPPNPTVPYTQPTMPPEEKKSSSTNLGDFFEPPEPSVTGILL